MKHWILCCVTLVGGGLLLLRAAEPSTGSIEAEGRALAAELRQQRPAESSTNSATLKLRDGDGRRSALPVTITTLVGDTSWQVIYHAATPKGGSETLSVAHHEDRPPAYEIAVRAAADASAPPPRALSAPETWAPFAGTSFGISDLGLEFLHWPAQRQTKQETFASRNCLVLESTNPGTNGYARVVSWIDAEHRGLLGAEAYDAQRRLVKRFFADSFKKVGDTWMLKDIKIRDARTDLVTELAFDLPKTGK